MEALAGRLAGCWSVACLLAWFGGQVDRIGSVLTTYAAVGSLAGWHMIAWCLVCTLVDRVAPTGSVLPGFLSNGAWS